MLHLTLRWWILTWITPQVWVTYHTNHIIGHHKRETPLTEHSVPQYICQFKHICNIAVRNLKHLDSSVITAGLTFIVHIKPPAMLESKLLMLCNLIFDAWEHSLHGIWELNLNVSTYVPLCMFVSYYVLTRGFIFK